MEKTKLGLPVRVMAAVIFFASLFGGYVPLILTAGYVLMREDNKWLRKSAFRAVFLMLLFSGIETVVGSVNEILSIIGNIYDTFIQIPINFDDILISAISIVKTAVFIILGIKALCHKD